MKYDMQLIFLLVGIGIWRNKIEGRGWFWITMLVATWIIYCWLRA